MDKKEDKDNNNNKMSYIYSASNTIAYLYEGATETTFKQFILDPIQDTILSKMVYSFMSLGAKNIIAPAACFACEFVGFSKKTKSHSYKTMSDFKYCGATIHEMQYSSGINLSANPLHEFVKDFSINSLIKSTSTIIFPFIYNIPSYIKNDNVFMRYANEGMENIVKYVGINPLEGVFAISNFIPGNNIIFNPSSKTKPHYFAKSHPHYFAQKNNLKYCGATIHEMQYGSGINLSANPLHEFVKDFAIHALIKITSTIIFPFIYNIPSYIKNDNVFMRYANKGIENIVKYVGINPLEGVFAISNFIPDNNIIKNNSITNWVYDSYINSRAQDPLYDKEIKDYNLYMEAVDGFSHIADYIGAINSNIDSPYMYLKVPAMATAFFALSYNTENKESEIDQSVNNARELLDMVEPSGVSEVIADL